MTEPPDRIPPMAKCAVCLKGCGLDGEVLMVQQATDEEGNEIEDGPIVWIHKECVGKENIQ